MAADFQRALEMFQSVSRRSAERQRLFVERAKANVDAAEERAASCGHISHVTVKSLSVLIPPCSVVPAVRMRPLHPVSYLSCPCRLPQITNPPP